MSNWLKEYVDVAFANLKQDHNSFSFSLDSDMIDVKELLKTLLNDGVVNNPDEIQQSAVKRFIRNIRRFASFVETDNTEDDRVSISKNEIATLLKEFNYEDCIV